MVVSIIDFFITLIEVGHKKITRKKFPFIKENFGYECGPRCLQMMFKYYGKDVDFDIIARETEMSEIKGTSLLNLDTCAKNQGFKTLGIKVTYDGKDGKQNGLLDVPLPCIAHWNSHYFVVLTKANRYEVTMVHPKKGKLTLTREDFCNKWISDIEGETGIALLIEKLK